MAGQNIPVSSIDQPLPRGISVERSESSLVIRKRWLSYRAFVFLLLAIALGIAFAYQWGTFSNMIEHEREWREMILGWFVGLCPIILSGIFFYLSLAECTNTTVIKVSANVISVRGTYCECKCPYYGSSDKALPVQYRPQSA